VRPEFFHGQMTCPARPARIPSPPPDVLMIDLELPPLVSSNLYATWPAGDIREFAEEHKDIVGRLAHGDMDGPSFLAHLRKIPRPLRQNFEPKGTNVLETISKVDQLISEATAFWERN